MKQIEKRSVAKLKADPGQPRKSCDKEELVRLGESMKHYGQIMPLIVSGDMILDGHRRWAAAQLVGITELEVREV